MKTPSPNQDVALTTLKEMSTQLSTNGKGKTLNQQEISPITTDEPTLKEIHPFTVVAIGASAGGLEAITQLLQNLSPTTGMAYIYVQHLSPDHKSMLTPILSKVTMMKVQDIDNMEKMKPNNFYIIPYDKEIEVVDGHIRLLPRLKNRTTNLSIDVLFSSLAETHKENVIGIVLSGSANDGTRGLKEIKLAGGITFAQDDSAKFSSMPNSAIAEGVVDFILAPKEIATELMWISKHPLVKKNVVKIIPEDDIANSNPDLKIILQLLHKRKNVDFSYYKMNTIKRRMLRRIVIHKIKSLKDYAEALTNNVTELDLLYQDLLINVTDFFRDSEAFLMLKNIIFPRLLKDKKQGDTIRIWVAACATGEEVYSIAMTLLEIQKNKLPFIPFQIFASDLSAEAIGVARTGEYSVQQLTNVSPKRLQQFFEKSKDKYRISKSLRDVCVFAQHNILSDPPFSRMDFISCRNFLIYLDTPAQKKAISTFHYALNDVGYLMLGKSETIGNSTQLFTLFNKKYKCYIRKKNSGSLRISDISTRISQISMPEKNVSSNIITKKTYVAHALGEAFDAALLAQHVPASVIINYDLEILQFRGPTSLYLQNSSGKASFNILKMAHLEITFELRNAIHHAIKTKQIVRKMGIEMIRDTAKNLLQIINIEVAPFTVEGDEPMLMIIFTGQQTEILYNADEGKRSNSVAKDRRIKKLEEELAAARADMGSITHDQEAVNEELQSANEEVISSNEELQSLNEELETSKEEIESTNEELTTSNQELHARIQQIEELYTYYEGIIATVHEPVLILDKNIRIKSANKSFCKMFRFTEDDIIGLSLYKLGDNEWNIARLRELLEDIVPKNIRFHDFEVEQLFPVIGKKTMLLNAHRIVQQSQNEELIVLTIADITKVKKLAIELEVKQKKMLEVQLEVKKKALKVIEDSNKRYNMLLMQSPFAFAIMQGKDMVISLANDSIKEVWGKGKNVEGKTFHDILPELEDTQLPALMHEVYTTGIPFQGTEYLVKLFRNEKLEDLYFNFVYQPYYEADETISGITIIAYEVTAQVNSKNEIIEAKKNAEIKTKFAEDAVKAKQQFLSNMSHEIRTPMNAIVGFTNVILKTKLDESQKQYLNAIKASGDALIMLINDILDLAKVDSGKMNFQQISFNLPDSIATMLQLFEIKIKEKNLELIYEYDDNIPQIFEGDPMRLRQIILNLLSNALKFTNKGKILLQISLKEEDINSVTIEFALTDTGIGIPKDRLENIFENFEQAHQNAKNFYGGTGLGLAIVKQLVEAQGGLITVKSELDEGTKFSFILRFKKINIKNTTEKEIGNTEPKIENVKVLVVEDIELNQLLIKIILMDFGFDVDVVDNGKVAIEKLKENKYNIILMDLQMPEMNGFEATIYIREVMKSQIPIIALTADVTTVDLEKCVAAGMDDYISKPIDEKLLYSKMIKAFKNTK